MSSVAVWADNPREIMSKVITLPKCAVSDIKDLPTKSAVYFVLRGDECLYIGRSVNLRQRWLSHAKKYELVGNEEIRWEQIERQNLSRIEAMLIRAMRPPLNQTLFDRVRCVKISAEVKPEIGEIIKKMAMIDERSISYVAAKLIEESPRIKAKIKEAKAIA